jgi:zinc protease
MRLLACIALAFALVQTPAAAQPTQGAAQVPPIAFKSRTLPNGLKVFTSQDKGTPNVTVQVWYGVGAKDDPQGRSGFAHLFEHMMFKATRNMPSELLDRLTEDVGGFNNASTWDDFTNYYEVVPAAHLERLLWAESERLGSLVVDDATFKSERDVVKEELRQRVLADPYGPFQAYEIPGATFAVHPYKRPGIGSIEDLDAATIADVRAFHATYYRPDNAALIVIGNFDEAQLNGWIDRYFTPIKTPAAPLPRVTAVEPPRTGPKTVTGYGANVPLPAVAITWLAPEAASPDAAALDVADAILSGGESSRLFKSLVYDQQAAQSIFSDADLRQQPGMFMVGAVMASGKSAEAGETALRAEVARLRDQPVSEAELNEAKNELISAALRGRESIDDRAFDLGYALMMEGDAAKANARIQELQAVTAADVQRVAARYLADDRRTAVRWLSDEQRPAGAAKPSTASPPVAASAPTTTEPATTLAPPGQRVAPPLVGAAVQAVLPKPVERTLANGLRVIVAQSTDLPLVSARLTVRTGGAADPVGKAGLADMTASLLTQGAGARSATEVAQAIESLGAQISASAAWDGSFASVNVMSDKLSPAMAILADVVQRPTFAAEELDRLRQRSLDGLQVEMKEPGSIARFVTASTVFAGTPYGHVLGGTPTSLPRLTREDVVSLHRTYYRPDNAVLVLAGDITPEAGFALAQQAFGAWARPAAPLPVAAPVRAQAPARVVVVDLPGTGQAAVTVALPAIPRSDPRYYPGVVANNLLGGGYSSRLNQEIRIKRGLSYGAGSSLDARRFAGPFTVSVQTKNESAPEVVDLIFAELARIRTALPEAPELTARKAVLTGGFGRTVATTDGLSGYLSGLALQDVPLAEMNRYEAKVQAVDPAVVRSFAQEVLDPARATIVVVGDSKLFLPKLQAKYPKAEVVSAAQLNLDSPALK